MPRDWQQWEGTGGKFTASTTATATAAAGTAKTGKEPDVFFTNGNWIIAKGCFHSDPHCPALKLATTSITAGPKTEAKERGLAPCRRCPVRTVEKSLHDELSAKHHQ